MAASPEIHQLQFLAPVPYGHEVLVATFRSAPGATKTSTLVLDQTTRILYCDDELWGIVGGQLLATQDPVAVLTKWSWGVVRTSVGRSLGAVISTKDWGDANHSKTMLVVEPSVATAPYR